MYGPETPDFMNPFDTILNKMETFISLYRNYAELHAVWEPPMDMISSYPLWELVIS